MYDPNIYDSTTFLSTLMGIIATLFSLFIATSVLIFQNISDYKEKFTDSNNKKKKLKEKEIKNAPQEEEIEQLLEEIEKLQEEKEQLHKEIIHNQPSAENGKLIRMGLNSHIESLYIKIEKIEQKIKELQKKRTLKGQLEEILKQLTDEHENFIKNYDNKIQLLNNVFVILAILVILFEIYNGMLIFFAPALFMNQSTLILLFSFAFFAVLVSLIICFSYDMFYYMANSQNPKIYDIKFSNKFKLFDIGIFLSINFITIPFMLFNTVFNIEILNNSLVKLLVSFSIACTLTVGLRRFYSKYL